MPNDMGEIFPQNTSRQIKLINKINSLWMTTAQFILNFILPTQATLIQLVLVNISISIRLIIITSYKLYKWVCCDHQRQFRE